MPTSSGAKSADSMAGSSIHHNNVQRVKPSTPVSSTTASADQPSSKPHAAHNKTVANATKADGVRKAGSQTNLKSGSRPVQSSAAGSASSSSSSSSVTNQDTGGSNKVGSGSTASNSSGGRKTDQQKSSDASKISNPIKSAAWLAQNSAKRDIPARPHYQQGTVASSGGTASTTSKSSTATTTTTTPTKTVVKKSTSNNSNNNNTITSKQIARSVPSSPAITPPGSPSLSPTTGERPSRPVTRGLSPSLQSSVERLSRSPAPKRNQDISTSATPPPKISHHQHNHHNYHHGSNNNSNRTSSSTTSSSPTPPSQYATKVIRPYAVSPTLSAGSAASSPSVTSSVGTKPRKNNVAFGSSTSSSSNNKKPTTTGTAFGSSSIGVGPNISRTATNSSSSSGSRVGGPTSTSGQKKVATTGGVSSGSGKSTTTTTTSSGKKVQKANTSSNTGTAGKKIKVVVTDGENLKMKETGSQSIKESGDGVGAVVGVVQEIIEDGQDVTLPLGHQEATAALVKVEGSATTAPTTTKTPSLLSMSVSDDAETAFDADEESPRTIIIKHMNNTAAVVGVAPAAENDNTVVVGVDGLNQGDDVMKVVGGSLQNTNNTSAGHLRSSHGHKGVAVEDPDHIAVLDTLAEEDEEADEEDDDDQTERANVGGFGLGLGVGHIGMSSGGVVIGGGAASATAASTAPGWSEVDLDDDGDVTCGEGEDDSGEGLQEDEGEEESSDNTVEMEEDEDLQRFMESVNDDDQLAPTVRQTIIATNPPPTSSSSANYYEFPATPPVTPPHYGSGSRRLSQEQQQQQRMLPRKPLYRLEEFILKRTLGTGSFGRVHLALHIPTNKHVALKVLRKADVVKLKQVEHTLDEKRILERLSGGCRFLMHLLGTFMDSNHLYLVMEYIQGGELFSLLRRKERFDDDVAKFYAAEVVLAFEYLHGHGVVYRDLKPENLLIDSTGHIKIIDFGFAKEVDTETWTLCGTPDYLAPEIIQSRGYGKAVDWWALGILIYEMIAGHPPFFDDDPFKLYEKILACRLAFPPFMDPLARDLIRRLLTPDLTKRFGNLKGGARDIKGHPWFEGVDWEALKEGAVGAPFIPPIRHQGDAQHFDTYDEDFEAYGIPGPDKYKDLFVDF
ncbi:camp-dependent protein kinase catalytic subunit [Blyttiomyces sp. JEL0837]|nr:camp-dependent protein kinase catalytic subunit [Blyttiomyces sp. JEL0837]